MKLRIKTALILVTLFVVPILQAEAVEIEGLKHYSENTKTRVVVQLSESALYKTQFDQDQNIIISLINTRLNASIKSSNINDGLVEAVAFENTKDNTVNVKVLLIRPAAFNVFPLESPARIVIDVLPVDNILKPEVVAISPSGSEDYSQQTEKISLPVTINKKTIANENTKAEELSADDNQTANNKGIILNTNVTESSKQKFTDTKSMVNYGFYAVVIIALIYMSIKVRGVSKFARLLRKNSRTLKEHPDFANILNEMDKSHSQESTNPPRKVMPIAETQNTNNEDSEDKEDKEEKGNAPETVAIPRQFEKVQEMAQTGVDSDSISEKSEAPGGEVNLILDLIKSRRSERAR